MFKLRLIKRSSVKVEVASNKRSLNSSLSRISQNASQFSHLSRV